MLPNAFRSRRNGLYCCYNTEIAAIDVQSLLRPHSSASTGFNSWVGRSESDSLVVFDTHSFSPLQSTSCSGVQGQPSAPAHSYSGVRISTCILELPGTCGHRQRIPAKKHDPIIVTNNVGC